MGIVEIPSKDNLDGFIALIAGIVLFMGLSYIAQVQDIMQKYPWVVVLLALVLFFNRKKLASKITNGNGQKR